MTRKEKLYNILKEQSNRITLENLRGGYTGFEASEIGDKADVSRNNASKELNGLFFDKRIIKIKGRPVYFFDKDRMEELLKIKLTDEQLEVDSISCFLNLIKKNSIVSKGENSSFQKLIGVDGSLEIAIKQAKAAILYPPRGLHTLLIGSTGVGKTTFAEIMYNFAIEVGTIKPEARFTIFNCSEYADNPQLLLSQLFGYVKGAFTGADKDKEGLIERTNGGVLLLDEIHRLSNEGQEMLFLLMDKNVYRRLGETEITRKSNILLIGATTEDLNSSFLKTFLRRIPMVIKLPSLSERLLSERLQMIKQFFCDEAKCVQVPIRVYKDVLRAFLLYECQGNIGQLKGDIQLTCARGFLDYKTYRKKIIEIETPFLSEHIYNGLLKSERNKDDALDILTIDNSKYYEFTQLDSLEFTMIDEYDISEDLYKTIGEKFLGYSQRGYSLEKINTMINGYIEEYIKKLLKKCNVEKEIPDNEELFKVISPRVYYAVDLALKIAGQKLKKKYSKRVSIGLCMHISALMERISEGKIINYSEINDIVLNNPIEFNTARLIREILEDELEMSISKKEIGLIAMFLYAVDKDQNRKESNIGIIVIAHGKSTASSISNVVNSLMSTNHCNAIDMSLDKKVEETLEETIKMAKLVDQGKGILLLVDMGSLVAFGEIITKKTGIMTKSVERVSTPMVLEAVRKSMLPEMGLEQLYNDIQNVSPYIGRFLTQDIKNKVFVTKAKKIITTCITGEGCALKLAQLLKNALPYLNEYNIDIIPFSSDGVMDIDEIEDIIAIVGTINLNIPNVPYIPIDDVIVGDGINKIEVLIKGSEENSDIITSDHNIIIRMLEDTLTFLNPTKAYSLVNSTYINLGHLLNKSNYEDLRISFLFHVCSMVERILREDSLTYNNINELKDLKYELYNCVKSSFSNIEESFGIEIPDTEIGYIMDLVDTK